MSDSEQTTRVLPELTPEGVLRHNSRLDGPEFVLPNGYEQYFVINTKSFSIISIFQDGYIGNFVTKSFISIPGSSPRIVSNAPTGLVQE